MPIQNYRLLVVAVVGITQVHQVQMVVQVAVEHLLVRVLLLVV